MKHLLLALCLLALHSNSFAQGMLIEAPLADRIAGAELIVEGEVIAKRSYWNTAMTHIYTDNTIRIFKVLKGAVKSDEIILTHKGGQVGLQKLLVNPGIAIPKMQKGIFFLYEIQPITEDEKPIKKIQTYKAFTGTQGIIKYIKQGQRAIDPFKTYKDIEQELYQPILQGRRMVMLNSFDPEIYLAPRSSRLAPPIISGFTPDSISAGNLMQLTINGSNFGASYSGSAEIKFRNADNGGASYSTMSGERVVSWTATTIVVTVPSRAGTGDFIVTNTGGESDTSLSSLIINYNLTNITDSIADLIDDSAGGYWFTYGPAFALDDSAVARFEEALEDWRCATLVNWEMKLLTTATDCDGSDGIFLVNFDDSCALPGSTLGTAFSFYNACLFPGDTNWRVGEVDIIFTVAPGGGWYKGVTSSGISAGESDFLSVAIHELGHAHQIGHTIASGNVMHYAITTGTTARTLKQNSEIDAGLFVMNNSADTNSCGPTPMINSTNCPSCSVSVGMGSSAVLCFGDSTGTATATPSGGTGSYTYTWSVAQSSATIVGLPTGTYLVTATDSLGCAGNNSVMVGTPTALSSGMDSTNVSCNAGSDGMAIVSVSGGTGGYSYSWSTAPIQTDDTAINLMAGVYGVTILDGNLCSLLDSVTIGEPSALGGSISTMDPLCFADSMGAVVITPSGGVPPYTYSWSTTPVQTDSTAVGLAGGTFFVTVTDANSCTYVDSGILVEPPPLVVGTSEVMVSCNGGSDGMAIAIASGGAGGYTYFWQTAPVQMNDTAFGLSVGQYIVIVADGNLCSTEDTLTVNEPAVVSASLSKSDVTSCGGSDGMAIAVGSGGVGGYTYSWNSSPVQNNDTAFNLPIGTFTVTVLDANTCSFMDSITLSDPTATIVTLNATHPSCNGDNDGSITAVATAGTRPYTYLWDTTPAQTDSTATGLGAGAYNVTVTDSNMCQASASTTLIDPAVLGISTSFTDASFGVNDGSATATPSGGTSPYFYVWSTIPVQTTSVATSLAPGNYTVTVSDFNSCSDNASVTVGEETGINITTGGVVLKIYPNPIRQFLYVEIQNPDRVALKASIYNLLGERIMYSEAERNSIQELKFDLGTTPEGTYLLKLEIGDSRIVRKLVVAH